MYRCVYDCLPLEHGLGIVQTQLPTQTDIHILYGGRFAPVMLLRSNAPSDLDLVVDLGCLAVGMVVGEVHVEVGFHLGLVVFCRLGGPGILTVDEYTGLQFEYLMAVVFTRQ